ncbi:very short patch repair endonuclease [Hymenobacter convexus]|uniref:very short patch repair endonuclease n=1 Tax=Hymenobacter sp. CA1UV-4 TaxID=3063782 RepID=UPI003510C2CE
MGRVRQRGTSPELKLRQSLHQRGLRFRLKALKKLPGTPDILFIKAKIAVFVDGCFWHGCPIHGTSPKTNPEFWAAKIARNKERDGQVDEQLREMGWLPIRVWEHETRVKFLQVTTDRVAAVVAERLEQTKNGSNPPAPRRAGQ